MSSATPPTHPSVGVLLSYGFGGAPDGVQPWADHLTDAGYTVEIPHLPGHESTWQQMSSTTWSDWYGAIQASFERLVVQHDLVFVGGLSMGGSLALRLAADRPSQVAGVLLVNPAVDLSARGSWMTSVLKHVIASVPSKGEAVKRPGIRESSYERVSVKAGHSMMKAMKPLQEALPQITSPLVFFRSVEDRHVSDATHQIVMDRISSTDATLYLLENSYHVATLDYDAPFINEESAVFISRVAQLRASTGR